ncbi:MAG: hypothetical protein LRY73_01620 [Bacillus sp. (in: Bacteria)]|nr:hypothetical protein [Bacillus sp. (in: firmicutes)]
MVHVMNVLFVDSIVAQWFFLLFLILMNALILTTNKKIGFQVTYVTLLSLAIALIMYTQLPYIYTRMKQYLLQFPYYRH